ncbi:TPA-induced transmembrane protein isoform X6 [Ascaphus truei]|uniref:TPA-induced transmembrane protein isoform X6 n=1 Tax=Ascaphus truei TaxID=8439 RepID=UPI003F59E09D
MEMFQKTEEEVCNTLLKTNKNWKQDKCNDNVWGKCKLWMTITFVFIMVAVITTLSLILYSQVYIDDDKFNQELPLNKSKCIFTGSLNISNSCIHMWEPLIRTKTELMNRKTWKQFLFEIPCLGIDHLWPFSEDRPQKIISLQYVPMSSQDFFSFL